MTSTIQESAPRRTAEARQILLRYDVLSDRPTGHSHTHCLATDHTMREDNVMIRLLWAASVRTRYFLRRYMPTNILLDLIRTPAA